MEWWLLIGGLIKETKYLGIVFILKLFFVYMYNKLKLFFDFYCTFTKLM